MHTAREVAAVVSLVRAAHCNPVYKALVCAFRFGTCQMMVVPRGGATRLEIDLFPP